ncbi:MAG: hypothetical protein ACRDXD_12975 [Acidimicrobiia bacterium]
MKATEASKKTVYALLGAPVTVARRVAGVSGRLSEEARKEFDAWVREGEAITKRLADRDLVESLSVEQVQAQVEKIRGQLEEVVAGWRKSLRDEGRAEPAEQEAEVPTPKRAAPKRSGPGSSAPPTT